MKTHQHESHRWTPAANTRPLVQTFSAGALMVFTTSLAMAAEPANKTAKQSDTAVEHLGEVAVQGKKASPTQKAKKKLDNVAGGTSVVDSETVSKGRTATIVDTLAYQPGVFAQAASANDGAKISIRGSGVNTTPSYFREGIKFMFDGLPITGPGGTPYELLGGSGVDYTEVLRGGNAFQYGASTLGGAINFGSKTGKTAPGIGLRFEAGSYDYFKSVLSYGGVLGKADYYVNVDDFRADGFRDYSRANSQGTVVNLGYQFSDKLETRLMMRYREEFHEDPGALTLAQLRSNPKQVNANNQRYSNVGERPGTLWLGSKTTYSFDDNDAKLEFGASYHQYQHLNARQDSANVNNWDWNDLGLQLRYSRTDHLFGLESRSSAAVTSTQHILGEVVSPRGTPFVAADVKSAETHYDGSHDLVLALGNELNVFKDSWLDTGLSFINVARKAELTGTNGPGWTAPGTNYNAGGDYNNWSLAPRVGLRHQLTKDFQVFGNYTRTIDTPSSWQYGNAARRTGFIPLVEQKADTVEIGVRGKSGIFDGSLVLYNSWLKDELLQVQTAPSTFQAFNASPTIHRGVEAGLTTQLWKDSHEQQVNLRQAYTFNDFFFSNNKDFGSNDIPGLPKNVYQAELQYQHPTGAYAGVNTRYVTRTASDYANTIYAPSYAVLGAGVGYEAPSKKWKVFLDAKNLTDEKYAAAVTPVVNARGQDSATIYPGDGVGVYSGFEVKY